MNDYLCHYFYFVWKRMFLHYITNTFIFYGLASIEAKHIAACEVKSYPKALGGWRYIHPHEAARDRIIYLWSN
ncbi:hypothetical protein MEG1DRAFT_02586 [Photorhabdus temperata subsp. temperata Meg1]|uniref:Uncharacterized protein n=1 Tax=Photorhabdus temperata subsp. temperata Meg1 TaxID=1393735 RepID=A0A081RW04_PHOTE|nr:hypothetical protein MEG1DRAFT_02586 [Photorhabdus temperata subsp. temperata Meg1]